MSYEDRSLACVECGQSFIFTADDQSYHAEKGYTNEPKRCQSCRQMRRDRRPNDGFDSYNRGLIESITSCMAMSMVWPLPVRSRSRNAARTPTAA